MMEERKPDFGGWATRNDLKCSDGRVIRRDAFKHQDGMKVPLVFNHQHNDTSNYLGHAFLFNRDEGVYAHGYFNETMAGKEAKELIRHGDISSLSIYANKLKQKGSDVIHGMIKEVSLVLAGANPGATIDLILEHGDTEEDGELYIELGESPSNEVELLHSDELILEEEKEEDNLENTEVIEKVLEHAGETETVGDIFNTLSEKQKNVVYAIIADIMDGGDSQGTIAQGEKEEENELKHNVFEKTENEKEVLTHDEMSAIFADGKRFGSLKASVLEHGITDIEYLFPEFRNVSPGAPEFLNNKIEWVGRVMAAIHRTPFARIKSMYADLTSEDARALGYIKGNLKKDQVFPVLKRTTDPQTIYKRQKLDRDDVIDIIDFDVVAWIRSELRIKLEEEIARAILVGDGRDASSDDHIDPVHVRPIWTDDDLYTIKASYNAGATLPETIKNFREAVMKSRIDYRGSGNPVLFTTEDVLTDFLLLDDAMGRTIYTSPEQVAMALRVSSIITVPAMEGLTRTSGADTLTLKGLVVNLNDYNVGADRGGAVSMFDDFDIDYNQQKYLIETRISGALVKPLSAIAIEELPYVAPIGG